MAYCIIVGRRMVRQDAVYVRANVVTTLRDRGRLSLTVWSLVHSPGFLPVEWYRPSLVRYQ